jgi:hypothetical protein
VCSRDPAHVPFLFVSYLILKLIERLLLATTTAREVEPNPSFVSSTLVPQKTNIKGDFDIDAVPLVLACASLHQARVIHEMPSPPLDLIGLCDY